MIALKLRFQPRVEQYPKEYNIMQLFRRSKHMHDMPPDFSQLSGDEIVHLQKENQAYSTGLRQEMKELLDSRLARKITKDEFDLQRRRINENVQVRKLRRTALDEARLTRAYGDRGLRQRVSVRFG
jgi:hypothetical protein